MSSDDPTEAYDPLDGDGDDVLRRLDALPSMRDDPVVWDPVSKSFIPASEMRARRDASASAPAGAPPNRHVVVGPGGPSAAGAGAGPSAPAGTGGRPRTPPPSGRPAPRPAAVPPSSRRKVVLAGGYKRRWPWPIRWAARSLATFVLLALFVGGGLALFGWSQFNKIERAPVGPVLSEVKNQGTNILLVGTDSREGIKADDPNAKAFLGGGEPLTVPRTDTILLLRIEPDRRLLLSIPRDLWVKHPTTGKGTRINAVYQNGPSELVKAVQALGIPVHHYAEISFVSFGSLVDAVGGVDIDFPHPARDTHSGLSVPQAGLQHLGGTQALAYVRSRYYEEQIDGKWVSSGLADLDRVKRQQAFLRSLVGKAAAQRNPGALASAFGNLGGGLKIDERFGYPEALKLGWQLRSFSPESRELKVWPRTTPDGQDVLDLLPASGDVIKEFQ